MSNKSERLSDAVGEVNDVYVTEAHAAPRRSSGAARRAVLIAACAVLLVGCVIAGVLIAGRPREDIPADSGESGSQSETQNGGDVLHINAGSVAFDSPVNLYWKSYTGTVGSRTDDLFPDADLSDTAVRLVSSSANTDTLIGVTTEYDEAGAVTDELKMMMAGFIGQYFSSMLSFDYEAHFAMFPQEMVRARFVPQIEERGLTYEQALSAIRENARTLVPFDAISLRFSVSDCREMTEEEVSGYLDGLTWMWENAGINTADIDKWIFCQYHASARIDGHFQIFETDEDTDPMVLFRFRGEWYMTPVYLDDDISVDLSLASKNSGSGFFRAAQLVGIVTWREGNLMCLNADTLIFCPGLSDEVKVGDSVKASGYSGFGFRADDMSPTESVGSRMNVYRAETVSMYTQEQLLPDE